MQLITNNGTKYWVFFMVGVGGWKIDQACKVIFLTSFLHQVTPAISKTYNTVQPKVAHDMNNSLMVDISEKEIKDLVFQMNPTKAPAQMEYPLSFFNNFGKL
ncbi:unnamed protein product [Prunus armeniaca]|uniref:Uncharacterized protein n=1 Tax=Prunus armeniaca TaxID=36596 RepID=A0A6J5WD11_PRUAR|nr:unnamed protein product [Prunus armeniaca]